MEKNYNVIVLLQYANVRDLRDVRVFRLQVTPADWGWVQLCHRGAVRLNMPTSGHVEEACKRLLDLLRGMQESHRENLPGRPLDMAGVDYVVLIAVY